MRGEARDVSVERVDASSGPVLVVRAREGATIDAVIARVRGEPEIVWAGRTELRGDPGERTADALSLVDRTGDGRPDVVVGNQREGFGTCTEPLALLFPRALDAQGALRPVVLRRADPTLSLAALVESPGPTGPPVIPGLRFVSASSAAGQPEEVLMLSAPTALTDGALETFWAEGRGGVGEGERVTARWDGGRPIRALSLLASPGAQMPAEVDVVIEGATLRVSIPAGATTAWIVPPEPLDTSCVSLVLGAGTGDAGVAVGLGEVRAYTEIDFGQGLATLIDELVAEGDSADRTATWLARIGEPAVIALDEAWSRLGTQGRRRALRVAREALRGGGGERAISMAGRAATDDDAEVRSAALGVLLAAGAPGLARLAELAGGEGAPAEEAATALAGLALEVPLPPLLAALDRPGGADRPALRRALGAAMAHGDRAAVDAWAAQAAPAALASAALGASAQEETHELAARLALTASAGATEFADRYRVALAAAALSPSPELTAWLASVARTAPEWMLRDAALAAIAEEQPDVTREALADAYPRVRVRAVQAIASHDLGAVLEASRHDPWPMVRVAALDVLGAREGSELRLREAIDDDAQSVRARAIELLTEHRDRAAWTIIEGRLTTSDEWPIVTEASLRYVQSLCIAEAGPALAAVVRRGARDGAWAPDVDAGLEALRIALSLGPEVAEEARTIASRAGAIEVYDPVLSHLDRVRPCEPR